MRKSVALIALAVQSAYGATFNVSNSTELQAALTTAATNGQDDVIVLAPGTYTGAFDHYTNENYGIVILRGLNRDTVILNDAKLTFRYTRSAPSVFMGDMTIKGVSSVASDYLSVARITWRASSRLGATAEDSAFIGSGGLSGSAYRSVFIGNSTPGTGAVRGDVYDSLFIGNTALEYCETLFVGRYCGWESHGGGVSGTANNSIFIRNSAGVGGAVSGTATGSYFSGNSAKRNTSLYEPGVRINNYSPVGAAVYGSATHSEFYDHKTAAVWTNTQDVYDNILDPASIAGGTPFQGRNTAPSTFANQTECLINWAETNYPQHFPAWGGSYETKPYRFRYYPAAGTYLGTSAQDGKVYYLKDKLHDLGALKEWLAASGC